MGATCKFRERQDDIISQELKSNLYSESLCQTSFKQKTYDKPKILKNTENSRMPTDRQHFFIIYPQNDNQRNDLILQLQNLNRNNTYYIEEYSQMDSQSIESSYESQFSLNGLSQGSFNIFRI